MDKIQLSNQVVGDKLQGFVISIATDIVTVSATALVGLGSVLVSLALVYVTRKNQKSQNEVHAANLAISHWENVQRNTATYLSSVSYVGMVIRNNKGAEMPSNLPQLYSEMMENSLNVTLLLPDSEQGKILNRLIADLNKSVIDRSSTHIDTGALASAVGTQMRNLLQEERKKYFVN
ncbi:hypothetical protein [Vibrio parahaemolyticus]|uniref:hypothetical protein n=1 Tax=Vibrio parahaemolyticus TaxID=670 RepID=UPI00111DE2AB|nr:hypothetical protein [Vibrio parahaemolyticus]TOG44705.1 hypothetical protein CGJ00_24520 [Vibrio parahaemolyticus]